MPNIKPDNKLRTIETVSRLLDSQFKIGNFRFGLDPILNLIPFAGDTSTALVSILLVYTMRKHGASNKLIVKMLGNVAIDFILGAIPFLGWVFDFYFKANDKNVRLLKEHYAEGKHNGSAKGIIIFSLIIFLLMIAAFIWATWTFTAYLFNSF
ncbi:hypothetical protein A5893_11430 [Pedobacter psychrophilus]|uniref:DUF4112 domain-containing protein n=1 Tax=Pedobacter psychrophilus TaxID=1826909 RepID=A0A179DEZ3_9SPHI|nr:DUF4112 domain-containing protein [Pedobacter psychrophilus]OAQ39270.1 hypothetical protein A5893_11430 [Pedobacter psychrophilus]